MGEKIVNFKLKDLAPGMVMGKTIINNLTGEIIIRKNEVMDESKIEKIKSYFRENRGIQAAAIEAEESIFIINGVEKYLPPKTSRFLKKVITAENQQKAITAAVEVMHEARMGLPISSKNVEESVITIIDSIFDNEDAAVNLLNIKNFDDYTYTHSVNVSTISLLVASKLKLKKDDHIQLGVGAMLHDLGKVRIPLEVLNKPDKLTDEEFMVMKKHPVFTYQMMKGEKHISDISKFIAAEHHEKYDGTGYPRGLKGEEINYFARIVAIADVYDALTTDRVYRKAMKPYDAMKIIVSGSGTHFDPEIVRVFLQAISIYPAGSHIKLNTGEIAVVEKVDSNHILRPEIIVIFDKNGKEKYEKIKLVEDKIRYIIEAVDINE